MLIAYTRSPDQCVCNDSSNHSLQVDRRLKSGGFADSTGILTGLRSGGKPCCNCQERAEWGAFDARLGLQRNALPCPRDVRKSVTPHRGCGEHEEREWVGRGLAWRGC